MKKIVFIILVLFLSSCSHQSRPTMMAYSSDMPPIGDYFDPEKQKSPEEIERELEEYSHRWFFGNGIGRTATNIGITIAYPPYGLYILGNAILEISGIGGLWPNDVMPEPVKSAAETVYDGFTATPGYFNAIVFDEPFYGVQRKKEESSENTFYEPSSGLRLSFPKQ